VDGQDKLRPRVKLLIAGDLRSDFEVTQDFLELLTGYDILRVGDILADSAVADEVEALVRGLDSDDLGTNVLLERLKNLRWIHSMTAGVEEVVSDRLVERGILLTNSAGCYAGGIGEYVLAALVCLFRGLPELLCAKRTGLWMPHELGREVAGSRVGVVGYGGIGRRVGELALTAGADVWAICRDPTRADRQAGADGIRVSGPDSLNAMLEVSDAVVVAVSLNASSHHMFDDEQFRMMKRSAVLVNVSRGSVIREEALVVALESRSISGAVIDTTEREPLPSDSKLWQTANLWITPHMAGGTREGRARALSLLQWNLTRYRDGSLRDLRNVVDVARELSGR